MTTKFYNDGQVKRIFPYLDNIQYFILGGPADGNEAQVLHKQYPEIRIIGIEPNPSQLNFQLNNEFPGLLINKALWSVPDQILPLVIPNDNRCGSLTKFKDTVDSRYKKIGCLTTTIDILVHRLKVHGNVFLWIDIEESELECLIGATDTIKARLIKYIYLEVSNDTEPKISEFLYKYQYKELARFDRREITPSRIITDVLYGMQT